MFVCLFVCKWKTPLQEGWTVTPDTVVVLYKYKYCTSKSIVPLRYSLSVHVAKLVITAAHHKHFSESHILKVRNWTKKLIYLDINSTADYNWFGLRFLLLWPLLLNLKIYFLGRFLLCTASWFLCIIFFIGSVFTAAAVLLLTSLLF